MCVFILDFRCFWMIIFLRSDFALDYIDIIHCIALRRTRLQRAPSFAFEYV